MNPNLDYARTNRRTGETYKDGCSKRNEDEVGRYLVKGATARQIAALTNLAYNTVNKYIYRLYRRYGVHTREDLVRLLKVEQKNAKENNLGSGNV